MIWLLLIIGVVILFAVTRSGRTVFCAIVEGLIDALVDD